MKALSLTTLSPHPGDDKPDRFLRQARKLILVHKMQTSRATAALGVVGNIKKDDFKKKNRKRK